MVNSLPFFLFLSVSLSITFTHTLYLSHTHTHTHAHTHVGAATASWLWCEILKKKIVLLCSRHDSFFSATLWLCSSISLSLSLSFSHTITNTHFLSLSFFLSFVFFLSLSAPFLSRFCNNYGFDMNDTLSSLFQLSTGWDLTYFSLHLSCEACMTAAALNMWFF